MRDRKDPMPTDVQAGMEEGKMIVFIINGDEEEAKRNHMLEDPSISKASLATTPLRMMIKKI